MATLGTPCACHNLPRVKTGNCWRCPVKWAITRATYKRSATGRATKSRYNRSAKGKAAYARSDRKRVASLSGSRRSIRMKTEAQAIVGRALVRQRRQEFKAACSVETHGKSAS